MTNKIFNLIEEHDVISFDVFDTAVLRPYLKPSDVFLHIERFLNLKKFAEKRMKAETKARIHVNQEEVTYDDIYAHLGKSFQKAHAFEAEFEKRICQRNVEIYQHYQYALEKNKKVIFVSDMYLPEAVVKEILTKNGFTSFDHLFVSSTHKKRKSSGELYDVVIEKTGTKPDNILHIGDNMEKDIKMAGTRGIHTFHYPKIIDRFLEEHSNMKKLLEKSPDRRFKKDELSISLLLGLNAILWIENHRDNYWTRIGAIYAGPFLYFFTQWIYDNAISKEIRNIAFAARDGFNLVKIFHLLDGEQKFNPHYVYLPRFVSESANLKNESDLDSFFKGIGKSYDGLIKFIEDFARENRQIMNKWEQFLDSRSEFSYNDLKTFITSNQGLFIHTSEKKRNIVYDYFNSRDLLNGDVMLVDSSVTKARPHKLIHNIIEEKNLEVKVFGYCYKVNTPTMYLDQTEIRPKADRKYSTDKWDFMEFFMSSPESPIIAIKKEGNDFYPVYEDLENNHYEQIRIKASEWLSTGIMQFAEKAHEIFGNEQIIKDLDTVVLYVNNLLSNPSIRDIFHIKHLHHSVNNDSDYNPLILKKTGKVGSLRSIHGQRVQVNRVTPDFEHFFMGSFDSPDENQNGSDLLAINIPFINRLPSFDDKATINIFREDGSIKNSGITNAWDFQHGAFLKHRPDHKNEITFSIFDKSRKTYKTSLVNYQENTRKVLPIPIISFSQDGKKSLGTAISGPDDYPAGFRNSTIAAFNRYPGQPDKNPGIMLMEVDTGSYETILPLATLLEFSGVDLTANKPTFVINKISFNPEGTRFLVQLGFITGKSTCKDIIITSDLSGKNLYKYSGMGLHVQWIDGKKLLISGIVDLPGSGKKTPTLYEVTDYTNEFRKIDRGFFKEAGHCNFSPDKRYILQDTHTTKKFPYRKLTIYDLKQKKGINLGYFLSHPNLYGNNPDLRCDLRARWSKYGKQIFFDSIHEGFRGVYKIDANEAINEIEREMETISEEEILKIISYFPEPEKEATLEKYKQQSKEKIKSTIKAILPDSIINISRKIYKKL